MDTTQPIRGAIAKSVNKLRLRQIGLGAKNIIALPELKSEPILLAINGRAQIREAMVLPNFKASDNM